MQILPKTALISTEATFADLIVLAAFIITIIYQIKKNSFKDLIKTTYFMKDAEIYCKQESDLLSKKVVDGDYTKFDDMYFNPSEKSKLHAVLCSLGQAITG